jgi:hypothetical protein
MIEFTKEEELSADIFASMLCGGHTFDSNTSMAKYRMTAEEAKRAISSFLDKGYFKSRRG